jgi:putative effector of murein hydrolase LrgA (UPF0299 family)
MDLNASLEVAGMGVALLNMGAGVIVGAAVLFLLAVAWLYRSKFQDLKAMLMVAMALIMLPAGIGLVQERTGLLTRASVEMRVENLQIAAVDLGTLMVYFTTPKETIAFVEYTDTLTGKTTTFFPEYPIARQSGHAVPVSGVGADGGTITFVIDGQKVLYQGKPVTIREER